jgi:hypothetical protein
MLPSTILTKCFVLSCTVSIKLSMDFCGRDITHLDKSWQT